MNNIIKYGVVFDTNVYRSLVISKKSIIELKKSLEIVKYNEKSHNVFSYAHPIVMSELLYHLTDINDKDYQTCKKAVYFLIEHCCDEKDRIHVIEDSESLLSHILFGINFDQNKKHVQSLQITCKYIHDNFDNNFEDWILEYLFKNKEYVEEKENEFAKLMEKHVIKYLNPTANSWNPLRDNSEARIKALKLIGSDDFLIGLAASYVEKANEIAGFPKINNEEFQNKILFVLHHFYTPLRLYLNILKKIIESGLDFTKNRNKNFFWDLDIAFLVGDNIYSKNEKIILVTNDRDILKAARETGCANSIMSLKDYNNFISLN